MMSAVSRRPPPTAPLHRYVSLFGADRGVTVYSDGLAEYEAEPSGDVAVTLVRSRRRPVAQRPPGTARPRGLAGAHA